MTGDARRDIAELQHLRLAGVTVYRRRRRPAAGPGLLRRPSGVFGWWLLGALAVVVGLWLTAVGFTATGDWWFRGDTAVADWFARRQRSVVTDVAEAVRALGSAWVVRVLLATAALVMTAFRRWRHLVTFAAVVLFAEWIASRTSVRPGEVAGLQAEVPMATVAAAAMGIGYSLLWRGRWRATWLTAAAAILVLVATARLITAEDLFTDAYIGGALGATLAVASFWLFVPDAAFPVSYAIGKKAHLSVEGRRAARVRAAMHEQLIDPGADVNKGVRSALRDQLGCDLVSCQVIGLEAHGLEGSAGSTPLRITVAGNPERSLFAKLYATSHLRSDRWYKLFRVIAYGALEDERPFTSVRRLVEYEDYMLRVFWSAGLPSARPFGIVSLQPEREYLVVSEFFDEAAEIDEVEITDDIMDQGLQVVQRMWDAGLAHRDLKPANLLVTGGEVKVIDVAFGTVRPSPWRQAVDLANMMLILALRRSPQEVYERALEHFAARDVAEAFAATRGITMPSQLRRMVGEHRDRTGIDLVEEFRALALDCPRISIQRWGLRRLAATSAVLTGVMAMATLLFNNLRGAGLL